MAVARRRQAEQRLQQAVDVGRGEQIGAARHQRDALQRVIDGDREVIARRHLLAGQHDVAQRRRIGLDPPAILAPGERPGARDGRRDVEAQRVIGRGCALRGALGRAETAASAGIGRSRSRLAARRRHGRSRPGSRAWCRSRDRAAPPPPAARARRGSRRNAPIAGGSARPNRGRARPDPRRSPRRTRRGSGCGRCPRAAAETGRPLAAPPASLRAPSGHGPDADTRSGSAQTG